MKQARRFLFSIVFSCAFGLLSAEPLEVRTGVYLLNLYDLNMDEHSFYADFYVWFKWRGDSDPTNIEFVNMVEKWGQTQAEFADSIVTLRDGTRYKIMRVEGRFFHSFSLGSFPLDEHALDIQIENPDLPVESVVYLPDNQSNPADVRNTLHLVGWDMRGCRATNSVHDYGTDFGNPEENARQFSNLTFTLNIARPFSYFLLKMLLPLVVVMLVSIGALLLHPQYIDPRSQLPIGSLLTAVFLQQSYNSALPDTGYMVLMDKIYLLCYLLISGVLLQVIIAGNLLVKGSKASVKKVDMQERWLALTFALLFGVGVVVLCVE